MTQVRETVRECDCSDYFEVCEDEVLMQCAHVGAARVALVFTDYYHICKTPQECCGEHGPWDDYESALAAFAKAEQELLRADE